MSKPYTESELSDLLDADLNWRRKELSDLKASIKNADNPAKPSLLRALVAMSYAHWEGYIKNCCERYFQFLTLKRAKFEELEEQIYFNNFLVRLLALRKSGPNIQSINELIREILSSHEKRFVRINEKLIDTKSNLNSVVLKELCLICGIEYAQFDGEETFIDTILLKRRNAIAHGRYELIEQRDIDEIVSRTLSNMAGFKTLVENKVYLKQYSATSEDAQQT